MVVRLMNNLLTDNMVVTVESNKDRGRGSQNIRREKEKGTFLKGSIPNDSLHWGGT